MPQQNIQFGSGRITITPTAGNLPTNPTPIQLKVLQDGQIDFKGELKKLYGQLQAPVATARGKVDITGKAKLAAVNLNDINQAYFAQAVTVGGQKPYDELHTPGATVTPTEDTGLNIFVDQGVINNDTGLSMIRVAASPAVGQYTFTPATTGGSPTAATYAFNASETASKVALSFLHTETTGSTLTLVNQAMGFAPVCQLALYNSFRGAIELWLFNSVTLGQFSRPTKQDDFWVSDIDFSINADASNTIGTVYTN